MKEIEEKVVPIIEKEIKIKESTLENLSGIFDAIQQTTRSEEFTQQRHQFKKMRSITINKAKNQGLDLSH